MVWVNCWMVRDLRTPFGGVKESGVGREGGWEALRFFHRAEERLHHPMEIHRDERAASIRQRAPEPVGHLSARAARGGSAFSLGRRPARARDARRSRASSSTPTARVVSYDIETQCHSVFQNVRYILEEAGSSWDELVDVTVFSHRT